jgi:hypothetical protein
MGEARDPRLGVADERNGAPDVAQRPQCEREVEHCCDAGVLAEAKGQIVVAAGLEEGQRVFQVLSRFAKLSGEPTRGSRCAVSDSCLWRIGSRLDVAEERLGVQAPTSMREPPFQFHYQRGEYGCPEVGQATKQSHLGVLRRQTVAHKALFK